MQQRIIVSPCAERDRVSIVSMDKNTVSISTVYKTSRTTYPTEDIALDEYKKAIKQLNIKKKPGLILHKSIAYAY